MSSSACAICFEPVLSEITAISCGHVYHRACLEDWFKINKSCPLCKVKCKKPGPKEKAIFFDLFFEAKEFGGTRSDSTSTCISPTPFVEPIRIDEDDDDVIFVGDGAGSSSSAAHVNDGRTTTSHTDTNTGLRRQLGIAKQASAMLKDEILALRSSETGYKSTITALEFELEDAKALVAKLQMDLSRQKSRVRNSMSLEEELAVVKQREINAQAELISTRSALNLTKGNRWMDIKPLPYDQHNMKHLMFNAKNLQIELRRLANSEEKNASLVEKMRKEIDELRTDQRKHIAHLKRQKDQLACKQKECEELVTELQSTEMRRVELHSDTTPQHLRTRSVIHSDRTPQKRPRLALPSEYANGFVLEEPMANQVMSSGTKVGTSTVPRPVSRKKNLFITAVAEKNSKSNVNKGAKRNVAHSVLSSKTIGYNGMGGSVMHVKRFNRS